jgi:hypothetical protein
VDNQSLSKVNQNLNKFKFQSNLTHKGSLIFHSNSIPNFQLFQ